MQSTNELDVQAVFNKVIDAGYYGVLRLCGYERVSPFMCIALNFAREDNAITWMECALAKTAIGNYLPESVSKLSSALAFNQYPSSFASRLAIYRNWANRPTLTRFF